MMLKEFLSIWEYKMEAFFAYMVTIYFFVTFMSLVKGFSRDVALILIVLATFVLAPLYAIGVMVDTRYLKII